MFGETTNTKILQSGSFIVFNGEATTIEVLKEQGQKAAIVFEFLKEEEMTEEQKGGEDLTEISHDKSPDERVNLRLKIAKLGHCISGGGTAKPIKCFYLNQGADRKEVLLHFRVQREKTLPTIVHYSIFLRSKPAESQEEINASEKEK